MIGPGLLALPVEPQLADRYPQVSRATAAGGAEATSSGTNPSQDQLFLVDLREAPQPGQLVIREHTGRHRRTSTTAIRPRLMGTVATP